MSTYIIFDWESEEVQLEVSNDQELQVCEIDENWELEGVYYE